jgi:hypothetical protein
MNIIAAILIVVFGMIITVQHILKCLDNENDSI